jgi:hypothetical protein
MPTFEPPYYRLVTPRTRCCPVEREPRIRIDPKVSAVYAPVSVMITVPPCAHVAGSVVGFSVEVYRPFEKFTAKRIAVMRARLTPSTGSSARSAALRRFFGLPRNDDAAGGWNTGSASNTRMARRGIDRSDACTGAVGREAYGTEKGPAYAARSLRPQGAADRDCVRVLGSISDRRAVSPPCEAARFDQRCS